MCLDALVCVFISSPLKCAGLHDMGRSEDMMMMMMMMMIESMG
jgi:hypothetical protein